MIHTLSLITYIITRVTDRYKLTQALVVDPLYLQHSYSESSIDYRVNICHHYYYNSARCPPVQLRNLC